MRTTGGTVRVAISVVVLMVASACAASPTEQSADAKASTATTGSTVDFFATTVPELAAVVPTTEEATTTTTEAPATTSTTADESHRSRSGGPVPGVAAIPPEFGSSGLLWIGHWLGHSDNRPNITFVLAPDGSVLRIEDANIYAGTTNYLTWNMGPEGYTAVVDLISEMGLESDRSDGNILGQSGEIRTNGSFGVQIDNVHATADISAEQLQLRKNFLRLMAQLEDMSWLEGIATVTQRAPWVPDQLAIKIQDEYNPVYYSTEPFAWPFDQSIGDMVSSSSGNEMWVCLEGAEAETAWTTFMVGGVNNARLPLEADGQLWEAGVRVSHAMYGGISPCPQATGFGTGSNERAQRADLSDLFLTEDDLVGDWTVTAPTVAPSPPNIGNCSPITDGEIAVAEFDSWLSHRSTYEAAEGLISGFQMLGEVPDGVDAVGVIQRVGTYSCLDGLAQFGVVGIESGMIDDPPDGVAAAAYWILDYGFSSQIAIDVVLDNGLAMVVSLGATVPMTLDDVDSLFVLAVEKAVAG